MSDNNAVLQSSSVSESSPNGGGNVTFANDVIATIAALAANETDGIAGMSSKGLSEMLGFKNLTKGVKVEVGTEEVVVDVYTVVKYGHRIQDVAGDIQRNVRTAVENMTGLHVVEVNVYVQGIVLEKENDTDEATTTVSAN